MGLQSSGMDLSTQSVSPPSEKLIREFPAAWVACKEGRTFSWIAQPLRSTRIECKRTVGIDRRGALKLDASQFFRPSWRKPVLQSELIAHLNAWAEQRITQWSERLDAMSLTGEEHTQALTELRRHELGISTAMADRLWRSSLNGQLIPDYSLGQPETALLRWVLLPRRESDYRIRRALARRHGRLLLLAVAHGHHRRRSTLPRWRPAAGCEPDWNAAARSLQIPEWVAKRLARWTVGAAPQWRSLEDEYRAWRRLAAHLPREIWPSDGDELKAAAEALLEVSPLLAFGTRRKDAHKQTGSREHAQWFVGQLRKHHGGSWRRLHDALRQDLELHALIKGTLPRLAETFALKVLGDPHALERLTKPYRSWTPGRWRQALLRWHGFTMAGSGSHELSWPALIPNALTLGDRVLSSPTHVPQLQQDAQALGCAAILGQLHRVLRGYAAFVVLHDAATGALCSIALLVSISNHQGEWSVLDGLHCAGPHGSPLSSACMHSLQALLKTRQDVDWSVLEWHRNWVAALDDSTDPDMASFSTKIADALLKSWDI